MDLELVAGRAVHVQKAALTEDRLVRAQAGVG